MSDKDGTFEREFDYKGHTLTARVTTTSDPVVGTITDPNGRNVVTMDLTLETQSDMRHENVGDPDDLLDALVQGATSVWDNPADSEQGA